MPEFDRILIQSAKMTMRKEPDESNYKLLVDLPAGANIVIHGFDELDSEQAYLHVSIAEVVETFDTDDEVVTDG